MDKITILTEPVLTKKELLIKNIKHILFILKRLISGQSSFVLPPKKQPYGGHFAVTRSLTEGLKKLGADFNYNPKRVSGINENVVVLSNTEALKQCITLKNQQKIKKLLAGPNLFILPSDCKELITDPAVDICIVNSLWNEKVYIEDSPELTGKTAIWPAGVDTGYFNPKKPADERKYVMIYEKNGPGDLIAQCKDFLRSSGYSTLTVRFGSYSVREFSENLQNSKVSVFFSRSESQGIALAEAWASDVPTLVWNPGVYTLYENTGRAKTVNVSSAPYLTAETGLFFRDFESFKEVFSEWESSPGAFNARRWVIENMSDELCAAKLTKLIHGGEQA
ncbi:MAG: hypothetical protein H7844_07360 [Nitrospirae bacterium YQR-1]